jgi:hypothetical protein
MPKVTPRRGPGPGRVDFTGPITEALPIALRVVTTGPNHASPAPRMLRKARLRTGAKRECEPDRSSTTSHQSSASTPSESSHLHLKRRGGPSCRVDLAGDRRATALDPCESSAVLPASWLGFSRHYMSSSHPGVLTSGLARGTSHRVRSSLTTVLLLGPSGRYRVLDAWIREDSLRKQADFRQAPGLLRTVLDLAPGFQSMKLRLYGPTFITMFPYGLPDEPLPDEPLDDEPLDDEPLPPRSGPPRNPVCWPEVSVKTMNRCHAKKFTLLARTSILHVVEPRSGGAGTASALPTNKLAVTPTAAAIAAAERPLPLMVVCLSLHSDSAVR